MATGKALNGKPYAGNTHVRFDEGEVAPAATPRRGSLLYKSAKMLAWVVAAAASAALPALAATVTVNAPAGSETNAFAFVAGEDSLAVNTGATGGIVHLSPYSTHTGGTTLGSGTLVLAKPVSADEATGELGAGPFVQQGEIGRAHV